MYITFITYTRVLQNQWCVDYSMCITVCTTCVHTGLYGIHKCTKYVKSVGMCVHTYITGLCAFAHKRHTGYVYSYIHTYMHVAIM